MKLQSARLDQPYYERADRRDGRLDDLLVRAWSLATRGAAALQRHRLSRFAAKVEQAGSIVSSQSDSALMQSAQSLRARIIAVGLTREHAIHSFALAREACARQLGLRHHHVQLMGAAAMLGRCVAEMQTGEGKTITAILPATTFALAGQPVHVLTVNDYLAERDFTHLRPVYEALGLSVGVILPSQAADERRDAYAADITYCTSRDLVFDYLRDRLALGHDRSRSRHLLQSLSGTAFGGGALKRDALLLRGLHVAIVDEADSLLVDDACTPLILSGSGGGSGPGAADSLYADALELVQGLNEGKDWTIEQQDRTVALTASGKEALGRLTAGRPGLWAAHRARIELAERALSARHLFKRDRHYVVFDGKIQIVDESTGRIMPDRSWEFGLHQMIEAKEGVEITPRKLAMGRITFQRFFGRYRHICGMSGTVRPVADELAGVYRLGVLRIPTHRPSRRKSEGAALFVRSEDKWTSVVDHAGARVASGQAVLIGTRTVESSERVSASLAKAGLAHVVLNALFDQQEAEIVAGAGKPGRITVATNMAGRGTDIRLSREVAEAGGLHVILTEYHESRRVDRQLIGRSGRQGDHGTFECLAALEDDLFVRFAPAAVRRLARLAVTGQPTQVRPAAACLITRLAQRRAGLVSAHQRSETLQNDRSLDTLLAFAGARE